MSTKFKNSCAASDLSVGERLRRKVGSSVESIKLGLLKNLHVDIDIFCLVNIELDVCI